MNEIRKEIMSNTFFNSTSSSNMRKDFCFLSVKTKQSKKFVRLSLEYRMCKFCRKQVGSRKVNLFAPFRGY